ncbi:MAG: hypothetical protein QOE46_1750 [Acidobacteriota bacterium]|jgi:hypothetical protein|nr:hypothetical protein [Acidobacteriota bacterium]
MRGYLLLIISALIVGAVIGTSGVPAQDNSAPRKQQDVDKAEFESQFPLTDVNKPKPTNPGKRDKWRAKGKKYKGIGLSITDSSRWISVNTEWDIGLPALPVTQSHLIVIGEVTDAEANLTEDKDWLYSEFTVRVDEVLKNTSNVTLTRDSSLVVDREGGRVRFPNGHITLQFIPGQGMPRVGRRYTLFLICEEQEQSIHILTGYELRDGRVYPIDNPAGGQHPIATMYKEADETSFLNDLRTAIVSGR